MKYNKKIYECLNHIIITLFPVFLLLGSFVGDLWAIVTGLFFLTALCFQRDWKWLNQPWIYAALSFWIWAMVSSVLSSDPIGALSSSASWIRFPLMAVALAYWLGNSKQLFHRFVLVMAVVSTILVAGIFGDRLMNPSQGKLFVFYGNPGEATRILLGVGMIPLLLLAARFADEALTFRRVLAPGGMAILLAISFPIGGDIYNSLIVALVVALFLFISRSLNTRTIGLGALVICLLALSLISSDALRERFLVEAPDRLPWLETSDYYPAWTGGIKTGFLEPIFGVGASQYYHHCKSLQLSGNLDILGVDKCSWHPHNVFIQVFAETGMIGLILYVITIYYIILTTIHNWKSTPSHQKSLAAIAVSSVFLFFWPFSTYSGAFAQHMNTITWFLIGASLGLSALTTQHSDLKSKLYKLPIINIKNSR